jgi:hypothetical protein
MADAAQATQALGVATSQAPNAMALMLATEFVSAGRIVAGCGPITHSGEFGRSEHR